MILDFSANNEAQYALTCSNQSSIAWYFYIYQRVENQSEDNMYSLVWMVSPYKIGIKSFITFKWSVCYSFYWLNTGTLQPGIVASSGGLENADLSTANSTTFDIKDNTPQLYIPIQTMPQGVFSIAQSANIPNGVFSTGIGMSDFPILIKQSLTNTIQTFGINTTYWVAASTQQTAGMQVLSQGNISNSAAFTFPLNQYNLTTILAQDNTWSVQ